MTQSTRFSSLVLACLLIFPAALRGATLMLTEPAVSKDHVVFAYANDLWICNIDGSHPRRLTSAPGSERDPVFSPDGKWLAFSGNYDNFMDVYLIPTTGGKVTRLTFHPMNDRVVAFTRDGNEVVFASDRDAAAGWSMALYTVPLTGGFPKRLPLAYGFNGSFSPDGKRMAYCPRWDGFFPVKHYRGGTCREIWLMNLSDLSYGKLPQPEGRCNDLEPWWSTDGVYFLSDRNGEFNLFRYDTESKGVAALTDFRDFPVTHMAGWGKHIVFEQAGRLHLLDTTGGLHRPLAITIGTDLPATRPRYCSDSKYIRNAWPSPTGKRLAVAFRGEIVTVPAKKGDPRNISQSPGSHERFPCWSPDGRYLACFSDASGEYELVLYTVGQRDNKRRFPLNGSGFYAFPSWSPDSKKICFVDNSRTLYILDVASGGITKIARQKRLFPETFEDLHADWSPDSRYIAYVLRSDADFSRAYIHSLATGKSVAITDGLSEVAHPTFDKNGKYLYLTASTNAGPHKQWLAMSNKEKRLTWSLYLMVLPDDLPSPLLKESDEETAPLIIEEENTTNHTEQEAATDIDLAGLAHRIIPLPLPEGRYSQLSTAGPGQLYYLEYPPYGHGAGKLHHFNLDTREDKVVRENVKEYRIAADNNHVFYRSGNSFHITTLPVFKPGALNMAAIRVKVEPEKEWRQIYGEAWRIQRDFFYDPGMHGADWQAVYEKYEPFLDQLTCRQDLNRLLEWMISEMAVGHHYAKGGDVRQDTAFTPVGLLGADFDLHQGRYRFKRIYGGLSWDPEKRYYAPLCEPGVKIQAGDYLLAVNGNELTADDNVYAFFTQTAFRLVDITVAKTADGDGKRTVQVEPTAFDGFLRERYWVEENLRKVTQATNGRVAYVYVPNTDSKGYTSFKRYFFPQCDREAVILDARCNSGGIFADYILNTLNQPYICSWTTRYGETYKSPSASIQGPKALLINEYTGSGGDLLAYAFRKLGLGPLIGTCTCGGLVGLTGSPTLIDGGVVSAPNLAFWTPEEGYAVENEGVPPDPGMEVEQDPAAVARGEDPQLEKAIEVIMQQLPEEPPAPRTPPPFPKRAK